MSVEAVLADLEWSGARVERRRGSIVVRARPGAVTARQLAAARRVKAELLHRLPDESLGLDSAPVVSAESAAFRLRSERYADVWIVPDEMLAQWFRESTRGEGLPVLTFTEVAALRGKTVAAVRAVLEVKRAFPSAKVLN